MGLIALSDITHVLDQHRAKIEATQQELSIIRERLIDLGVLKPSILQDVKEMHASIPSGRRVQVQQVLQEESLAPAMESPVVTESGQEVDVEEERLSPVHIYVCGGSPGDQRCLDVAHAYRPASNDWHPLPKLIQRRAGAAAGVLAGKLYVCGGCASDEPPMNSVECFDPAVGVWEIQPRMLLARYGAAAAVLQDRLYVSGGWGDGGRSLNWVERFNPVAAEWQPVPAMTQRRAGPAVGTIDDHIYVCGGRDGQDSPQQTGQPHALSTVECFDAFTCSWEVVPPMKFARSAAACAVVATSLYVCGGWDGVRALSSVEVFLPEVGAWAAIEDMCVARLGASAAAVAGRLYVFGGSDGPTTHYSAERFNPLLGVWALVTQMPARRSMGIAAAVPLRPARPPPTQVFETTGINEERSWDARSPMRAAQVKTVEFEEEGELRYLSKGNAAVMASSGSHTQPKKGQKPLANSSEPQDPEEVLESPSASARDGISWLSAGSLGVLASVHPGASQQKESVLTSSGQQDNRRSSAMASLPADGHDADEQLDGSSDANPSQREDAERSFPISAASLHSKPAERSSIRIGEQNVMYSVRGRPQRQQGVMYSKVEPAYWRYVPENGKPILPRQSPSIDAEKNFAVSPIQPNTVLEIIREQQGEDDVLYLQLPGGAGWLYDKKPGVGRMCVREGRGKQSDRFIQGESSVQTGTKNEQKIGSSVVTSRRESKGPTVQPNQTGTKNEQKIGSSVVASRRESKVPTVQPTAIEAVQPDIVHEPSFIAGSSVAFSSSTKVDESDEDWEPLEFIAGKADKKLGMVIHGFPPGIAQIDKVLPGTWADSNGIMAGDFIISIHDEDLESMRTDRFKELLTVRPLHFLIEPPGTPSGSEDEEDKQYRLERTKTFARISKKRALERAKRGKDAAGVPLNVSRQERRATLREQKRKSRRQSQRKSKHDIRRNIDLMHDDGHQS